MAKKGSIVVLRRSCAIEPKVTANKGYLLLKSYWFNGEGWYKVRDEDTQEVFSIPDIFLSDCMLSLKKDEHDGFIEE